MKQVFLSGQGQIAVFDAPVPSNMSGGVIVRNAFSLISAGTEGSALTRHAGIKGMYEKVMKSRDRLDQVWGMVQSQGFSNTLSLIQNKLEDHNPLGYSCAGQILEVGSDDLGLKVGQRVACMGTGFANHAEFVVAPKNLTVALPDSVSYEEAAFAAISCIAMQGIRRLDLSPGETVVVVGLGLIGQIALRLASTMGYRVYGVDIDAGRVAHAKLHGQACAVFDARQEDPVAALRETTSGYGVDGVVICASAKVDEVINQAFDMCRRRGRVSVVGDIGLGLQRAKMYAKELEVRLSCSYGLGRYDLEYELMGHDYPLPYVRWTERRNLEYFLQMLAEKRLCIKDLISARVSIVEAQEAYALIKSGNTDIYGVLLDYQIPAQPELPDEAYLSRYSVIPSRIDLLRVGLIGVGAYAKNIHLPNLIRNHNATVWAVASKSGASAAIAARKAKAHYATSDVASLLDDSGVDAVVISTRHSSHASLVLKALEAGKHVFVEKPMATNTADCLKIIRAQQASGRVVRVGYNRRFAPMLIEMKRAIGTGRKVFNVRVNVGDIGQHWSNTAEEGGRLLGEGVHFFDLATWVMDSTPIAVSAQFVGEPDVLNPNASICIKYENGSIANISYITLGHTARGKEYFELFGNGRAVSVNDYKQIESYGCKVSMRRYWRDNKGQKEAIDEFIEVSRNGECNHGADAIAGLWATVIAEAVVKSAKQEKIITLKNLIT